MHAIVWDGNRISRAERPEPVLADDMAIIQVSIAGICNTDLEIVRGYMGFEGILGHEVVGRVSAGPQAWIGRRVVAEINFACGTCTACGAGLERHCPTRRVMGILNADGAFAESVAVPVANLHAVPESVADDLAVFTEPLAAAHEIVEQLSLDPAEWSEQRALVLGDGKLGLLVAQVLQQAGASVVAIGRHDDKLRVLRSRGIETHLRDDWQPDKSADLVVDATGSSEGFRTAVAATRPRGTVVLKSTVAGAHNLDLAPLVIDELQVLGSRCGPFEPALAALAAGEVDVRSLISDRMALVDGEQALRRAAERGVLKVLLECS